MMRSESQIIDKPYSEQIKKSERLFVMGHMVVKVDRKEKNNLFSEDEKSFDVRILEMCFDHQLNQISGDDVSLKDPVNFIPISMEHFEGLIE